MMEHFFLCNCADLIRLGLTRRKKINKKVIVCEGYVAMSDEKIGVREIRTTLDECIKEELKALFWLQETK